MRKIVACAALAAAIMALSAGPAAAAKGGIWAEVCSSPSLSGPTSVAVGATYTVAGCGFAADTLVPLSVGEAGGCCYALNVKSDASGSFSYSATAWGAGAYSVTASEYRHGRLRVAATWSFNAA